MATRRTKGIDTSSLPSTQDLIALSQRANPADALNAITNGVSSGFNLSQTLADRQIEHDQKVAQIQKLVADAKAAATQKSNEQNLANTISQTTPAAIRPVSTIPFGPAGGQPVMAKQTQSFEEQQPARVDQAYSTAFPEKKAEEMVDTRKAKIKSDTELANAKELQNIKFGQAKELLGMKQKADVEKAKGKGGKIPVSLINDMNLIENQSNQLDSIEKVLTKSAQGPKGFTRDLLSKVTLGNIAPELRLYDQNRPAVAVSIYRALTGDTRLSDSDAKARALPLLPVPGEPSEVHKNKIAFLRAGINRRKEVIKHVSEMAKANDLSPDQITSLSQIPLPGSAGTAQESNQIDPSQFIEE